MHVNIINAAADLQRDEDHDDSIADERIALKYSKRLVLLSPTE